MKFYFWGFRTRPLFSVGGKQKEDRLSRPSSSVSRLEFINEMLEASLNTEDDDWVTSQDEDELIQQLCAIDATDSGN